HGAGGVELPSALLRKYPNAGRSWGWQWVFPATRFYLDRVPVRRRRHHLHESVLQRAVKDAVRAAGIVKPATCHTSVTPSPRTSWRRATISTPSRAPRPPGRQHHDDLHPRPQPRPRWGPKPRRPDVPMMGRPRRECVLRTRQISRDVSPYITPQGIAGVLQGGGKSSVQRVRSHRVTGIYRPMQFNNAVQDTER